MIESPRHLAGPIYEWRLAGVAGDGLVAPAAVRCTTPDGQTRPLAAFRDGDAWLARLWADAPGRWRWQAGDATGDLDAPAPPERRWPRRPLRLSADRLHFLDANGAPFFYLADTAWTVAWKGREDEWPRFLDHRVGQGYNALQVCLLPWRWEYTDAAGNLPFLEGDPSRPNPAYFARFDAFLAAAATRGFYVCLMLIWGGPRRELPAAKFTTDQAVAFAEYAVARFGTFPMLWSLSGDGEYAAELEKWEAIGGAVERLDPSAHPTTMHLEPGSNWLALFDRSPWHDFHMWQTGHRRGGRADIAALSLAYAHARPRKATVNGEPWYEAHPSRDTREYGPKFTAAEVRYAFWTSVLNGATLGHTYGSQGVWNWNRPGDDETEVAGPQIGPPWYLAMEHAGASHCGLGAQLLREWPWDRLEPCPERIELVTGDQTLGPPSCATLGSDRWLAYLPHGGTVRLQGLGDGPWSARWLDPRSGETQEIGRLDLPRTHVWQAPPPRSAEDWLLVVEQDRAN